MTGSVAGQSATDYRLDYGKSRVEIGRFAASETARKKVGGCAFG
jgi:hypothetical protein